MREREREREREKLMSSTVIEEEEELGMGKLELVGGGGGFDADDDDDDEEDLDQSTSSPCFKFRYGVFLSYRGEDTRNGFTENLYKKLNEKGIICTFRDEQQQGLEQRGDDDDEIHESVLTAIEDSATSVAVISPNYANSGWCLEELSKILESRRLLFPVFYQVDPSHVRHLKGTFGDDFRIHEQKFGQHSDKVLRWKKAMEKAGGIAGWDSRNWEEEPQLIQSLVKNILTKLSNTPLSVAKHPIGIESRVEHVVRMLNMDSNGVQAVGFHGMGGIGKTTLAKAVYNKIVTQFEHRSFISDIRQVSKNINGLISLQDKLIRNLFPDDTPTPVDDVGVGIMLIKQRIQEKKVLVVLDDVDDIKQLNALAGSRYWFHAGSRIIITTRDTNVLKQNLVNEMFEVKELNRDESLQLFSSHAFSREKPTKDFMKLSEQVVSLTGQLPLALEVIGTFFFDKRRIKEWEDALEKLKHTRPRNLHDVLMISFNALDEQEKCIFLDIACFFVGMEMERENAIDILKGCGFNAEIAITVLTARSLVKTVDNKLRMHDQLRDMGRQLVRNENLLEAGKRTRLWDHDEIMKVLRNKKGTGTIQGIILSLEKKKNTQSRSEILINQRNSVLSYIMTNLKNIFRLGSDEIESTEEVHVPTTPFEPMSNLRLLQINHLKLEGTFKFIFGELKWLEWKNCPLESLPSDFCPSELAVLDLSRSKIKQVWAQSWWRGYKMAEKLIVLNLSGCCNLTATPDFSGHPCLEKLILERCTGLVEIHKSIGDVGTLRTLNLKDCSNLVEFPNHISGLRNLENFDLSGCSKLEELPRDLRSFKSLLNLLADGTAIRKLPDSISCLKRLERLSLNRCTSLKQLPDTIGQLGSLTELSLNDSAIEAIPDSIGKLINLEILSIRRCRSITAVPDSIGNLESLVELLLNDNTFEELPDSMFLLSRLKHLSLGSCRSLKQLPASVGGLVSLVELCMDKTSITGLPDEIGNLTILKKLEMRDCELLSRLPDSIGNLSSLTTFRLMNAKITELPESIRLLKKLEVLNVNNCKRLSSLPTSFGELESLRELRMERTGVTYLPKEFGMLSRLMILKMGKRPQPRDIEDHTKTSLLNQKEDLKFVVLPDEFSNLSLLYELDASYCKISGIIPDAFEKLSSLEDLKLNHNNFCRLPSSLRGLVHLKQLSLSHCTKLELLPPLPSSLDFLDVTNCTALESISDLSNLENLLEMRLTNCKKVKDIPGLKCLSLLKRLYLGGCNACFASIRKRLHKVALERLRNLCVPGSEIPSWLIQEVPSFLRPRNCEIKGVIVCVVISLQQQEYPESLRSELPAIVDIQAKIIRNGQSIFTTTLYLMGVPDTSEDQVHLCRYVHFHPLVSLLEEGDNIQVAMRNPPVFQGLHLKKYGIHLVFEDDDDIDDDDETMDETELSVTGRLANYVSAVA